MDTARLKSFSAQVFFNVGLNYALRGVQEHHDLVPAQFCRVPVDSKVYNASVYYEYTEFLSKNNQHRFNSKNKTARAYAIPGSKRCLVKLFYLPLLPPGSPYFYMQGLEMFPSHPSKNAFKNQRVWGETPSRICCLSCHADLVSEYTIQTTLFVQHQSHVCSTTAYQKRLLQRHLDIKVQKPCGAMSVLHQLSSKQ